MFGDDIFNRKSLNRFYVFWWLADHSCQFFDADVNQTSSLTAYVYEREFEQQCAILVMTEDSRAVGAKIDGNRCYAIFEGYVLVNSSRSRVCLFRGIFTLSTFVV